VVSDLVQLFFLKFKLKNEQNSIILKGQQFFFFAKISTAFKFCVFTYFRFSQKLVPFWGAVNIRLVSGPPFWGHGLISVRL
jgi:hypothetical protein